MRWAGPLVVSLIVFGSSAAMAQQVAAGLGHTCAINGAGELKCWGLNADGQLGDGTTTDRDTPVKVKYFGSGATAVIAGRYHTCALTVGGAMKCWGRNFNGQLGDGTAVSRSTADFVKGLKSGVIAIGAGAYHTCAVLTGGVLQCWGLNAYGQLGDGTLLSQSKPTKVKKLTSGVVSVAGGGGHTCAATDTPALKCWGWNVAGQLGDGTTTDRLTATSVKGMKPAPAVGSISGGLEHTCAITTAGALKCWGLNADGQIGDGTTTDALTPASVTGLGTGVTSVGAGGAHSCAAAGGAAKCWGSNSNGQLGNGTNTNSLTAVNVTGLGSGIVAVAAGLNHSAAMTGAAAAKDWGWNGNGQLGNNSKTDRNTPATPRGF